MMLSLVLILASILVTLPSTKALEHKEGKSAYFKVHKNSILLLDANETKAVLVQNINECGHACFEKYSCLSFNIAIRSDKLATGHLLCEVLANDKYNEPSKLVTSKDFHHYSILTPCLMNPCKNRGKCIPHYQNDTYTCQTDAEPHQATSQGKDCKALISSGVLSSGVYTIDPDGGGPFNVFCDMDTDGGGWTVIQRRRDGSVDFYLGWTQYKIGFGSLTGEFWLGNDKIHRLIASRNTTLRVDLGDWSGNRAYAKYGSFRVDDENNKYRLTVGSYSGTAGDALAYHNGMFFSTKDRDNDKDGYNCAQSANGAWWYNACKYSNLNGRYIGNKQDTKGINWLHWKRNWLSMNRSTMMTRS